MKVRFQYSSEFVLAEVSQFRVDLYRSDNSATPAASITVPKASVTGPDASGVFTADLDSPAGLTSAEYYAIVTAINLGGTAGPSSDASSPFQYWVPAVKPTAVSLSN